MPLVPRYGVPVAASNSLPQSAKRVLPRVVVHEGLDGREELVGDDARHPALDPDAVEEVDAPVLIVGEHTTQRVGGPGVATRVARAGGVEPLHDGPAALTGGDALEGLADEGRLVLVDLVAAVGARAVAVDAHAVDEAALGVAHHAAQRVLREVAGVVLVVAVDDGLEDHPLGPLGDGLHGGLERHAALREALAVDGGVEAVAREAVELVDEHRAEVARARVGDHAQELRALVARAREGAVGVGGHHGEAVPLRPVRAHAHLVLDGLVALLVGREARVDHARGAVGLWRPSLPAWHNVPAFQVFPWLALAPCRLAGRAGRYCVT